MIITITLNPAIDRTLTVDNLQLGNVNRANNAVIDIGGKGINVSRAIGAIGGESVVLGFCGGTNGRTIKDKLTSEGIHHDFVDVIGTVRTNIKIIDNHGAHTDINESGFTVTDADFLRFLDRLDLYLNQDNIFVLSGSVPAKFNLEYYKKICTRIKKSGAKLVVDASRDKLLIALEKSPYFVKPNKAEASIITDMEIQTAEDALIAAKKICEMGAKITCISLGGLGAVFYENGQIPLYIKPKSPENNGPVGAGDAMVGGFVHSMMCGYDFEKSAKMAVSTGTASVKYAGNKMGTLRDVFSVYDELLVYVD